MRVASEAEAPVDYNAGDYPPFAVTVDVAIFTIVIDPSSSLQRRLLGVSDNSPAN